MKCKIFHKVNLKQQFQGNARVSRRNKQISENGEEIRVFYRSALKKTGRNKENLGEEKGNLGQNIYPQGNSFGK